MSNGNLVFAEYGTEALAKPNYQSAGPGLAALTPAQLAAGDNGNLGYNTTTANTHQPVGSTTVAANSVSVYSAFSMISANGVFTLAPTGTGTGTINPATAGSINNMNLGVTTPLAVRGTSLAVTYTDHGATASPVASTTQKGRVRIPLGVSSVQVTNASIVATCMVLITQRQLDTTLTRAIAVAAAGSFTITGNAVATADTDFDYCVLYT